MNCKHDFLEYVQSLIEKDVYDFFASPREKVLFGKGRQARIIKDVSGMMGGKCRLWFLQKMKRQRKSCYEM